MKYRNQFCLRKLIAYDFYYLVTMDKKSMISIIGDKCKVHTQFVSLIMDCLDLSRWNGDDEIISIVEEHVLYVRNGLRMRNLSSPPLIDHDLVKMIADQYFVDSYIAYVVLASDILFSCRFSFKYRLQFIEKLYKCANNIVVRCVP